MSLSSPFARCALAMLLWLAAMALDLAQRAPVPAAGQAAVSATPVAEPQSLRWQAAGKIPMPEGANAAHASNLLALPQGQSAALLAFWFAGDYESAANVQIAAAQFDRSTQRWSLAHYVVNRQAMAQSLGFGLRRLGNPVSWLDRSGRVHLFVVATGLGGWAAGRVLHLVQSSASLDPEQLRFAPVRVLPLSWFWNISYLVRNPPMALSDGGMLLPAYFELGSKFSIALRFDAQGEMAEMQRMSARHHVLQATLLPLSPSRWLALMRDQRPDGHVTAALSADAGQRWEDLPDLELSNPDSALAGLRLGPQQFVLAHNSSAHSRAWLDLSYSSDGLHWATLQSLAHGVDGEEYSYPAVAWSDNALWVSFTDHRRGIAWQKFAAGSASGGSRP